MKHKIFACLLCVLILVSSLGGLSASAEASKSAEDEVREIFDGILSYHKVDSAQAWIDRTLTQKAGVSAEWSLLALSQYGDYDFASYEGALLDYLARQEVYAATTRQKYALCLISIGSTNGYISAVLGDSIGKQGIMSYVYGLHLLNNGYVSKEFTTNMVIEKLLSLQCEDGGWSLAGKAGDVDVTAMTVQALALHYDEKEAVGTAIDRALAFLSQMQLEDGDYLSYGVSNPESPAQVLVALSALGIDFETDERFIKNGNTLLDGILKYRLEDGSFCHTVGGKTNENATSQVFFATVSYQRMKQGKTPLYLLDRRDPTHVEPAPEKPSAVPGQEEETVPNQESNTTEAPTKKDLGYKPWVSLILLCAGGAGCLVLFLLKKRSLKNFIAVGILTALAVVLVCVTDIQSAEDYYSGEEKEKPNAVGEVTLTIRCDRVVGKSDAAHIPSDGVILDTTTFLIEDGDTVYDILTEAAKQYQIQIENNGSAELAYIVGINYLYEFDFGDLSGWVYRVNGESPSVGCSSYVLKDGDRIEWLYSLELGNDLK